MARRQLITMYTCCCLFLSFLVTASALVNPLQSPDAMATYRVSTHHHCQRLCWYRKLCVTFSYSTNTVSQDNCVLHNSTAIVQGGQLLNGWIQGSASDVVLPAGHGCLARPCGDTEICVPSMALHVCLPLSQTVSVQPTNKQTTQITTHQQQTTTQQLTTQPTTPQPTTTQQPTTQSTVEPTAQGIPGTHCSDPALIILPSGIRLVQDANMLLDPLSVYCDQDTDGGGWMVFQRRQNGSENFYRGWTDYVDGFGNPLGEHWLGLEAIHTLTTDGRTYELRVDMEEWDGRTGYAVYQNFSIGDSSTKYTLHIGAFTDSPAVVGDSLRPHDGMRFSTLDQDNDLHGQSCAQSFTGAWWYKQCHEVNLNGVYYPSGPSPFAQGVVWMGFTTYTRSLKFAEMKFRQVL